MIASAMSVIALFATGALLSTGKPMNNLVLTIHRVTPALLTLSAGASAYLLTK
ncbi:MAG: hypothetical protein NT102_01015 [Caldiserica bacterium]|nr:hypothetical protein [Caldisericota bacterium]